MISLIIKIGDEEFKITPNFSVVEGIEQRISLLDFTRELSSGNPKYSSVAWVIYCALSANGIEKTFNDCGVMVMQNMLDGQLAASEIITAILNSGPEKQIKKNLKEA